MGAMNDLAWFLARASGIVAVALGVASLVLGVLFSARQTGNRRRPNWWLDLHDGLGLLTLAFTGLHMAALLGASSLGIGLAQLLVPGASAGWSTAGLLTGVLAFYGFAAVVATSWPRRRLGRRGWHLVHLVGVPAVVLGGVHGLLVGSDGHSLPYELLLAALAGLIVYPLVLRLWGLAERRRTRRATAALPVPPARPLAAGALRGGH